ncbi:MAG: isochorismatase family protein [Phocaeicola sp.]|uniref:isochorismatase family protein n=1 Tax=Phocaeicola sp. TaxID=2773926 RepID=UPI003FA00FD7
MNKNTLIIVDFQVDFCSKKGSLYVPSAEKAMTQILKLLNSEKINRVLFTVDWHPITHSSFKENGGIWPVHCVQYSTGASIPNQLIEACYKNKIPYEVIRKGTDPSYEQYSGFIDLKDNDNYVTVTSNKEKFRISKKENLTICGLAGDFCVYESVKSLCQYLHPSIFKKGIGYISDTDKLDNLMKEQNLVEIK